MSTVVHHKPAGGNLARRFRVPLVIAVVVRTVLGIVAAVIAPMVWKEHALFVVALRPTKEVLLASGFLVRSGRVNAVGVVLAALPLLLAGVWLFYALGKGWEDSRDEIPTDSKLGQVLDRVLPAERLERIGNVLAERGVAVIVLGRLAAFPSSLIAAAAGRAGMPPLQFVAADTAGALLSLVEIVGAGWLLGETYDRAGPWITGLGVLVLVAVAVLFGRWLQKEDGGKKSSRSKAA